MLAQLSQSETEVFKFQNLLLAMINESSRNNSWMKIAVFCVKLFVSLLPGKSKNVQGTEGRRKLVVSWLELALHLLVEVLVVNRWILVS